MYAGVCKYGINAAGVIGSKFKSGLKVGPGPRGAFDEAHRFGRINAVNQFFGLFWMDVHKRDMPAFGGETSHGSSTDSGCSAGNENALSHHLS